MRLFKRNFLRDFPVSWVVVERDGERFAHYIQDGKERVGPIVTVRRKGLLVDRIILGTTRHWYGKVQLGPKSWRTVRLFTDKTASERELQAPSPGRPARRRHRNTGNRQA